MTKKDLFAFSAILSILIICLLESSCNKEIFTQDPGKILQLEDDTLSFDTVFATIGSATRYLKIYNNNDQSIAIEKAFIAQGNQSDFRMNIDGLQGNNIEHIEIRAHDSIYLFCEVTVNPNDPLELSPFIKMDSVILQYNGIQQSIVLMAWGQNANYFPAKLNKGQVSTIDLKGTTMIWDDAKPYIIYGIVYFDNGTLIIPENTKVHIWGGLTKAQDQNGETFFYNDGRIIIGPNANIKVMGTKEKPVIFQGVRLESFFKDVPGQWSGIFIDKMSTGNEFHFAEIRNNLIGIVLDSLTECKIEETKIYNNTLYGLYASTANLEMNNSLFYNQGSSSVILNTGGNYELNYCTFANYGNSDPALFISNSRCIDFPFCELIYEFPLKVLIRNSVITGSDEDELWMSEKTSSTFEPVFQNCLFRITDLTDVFPDFNSRFTSNCINYFGYNKLFKDLNNEDFHPDTLSVLETKAIPISKIQFDLDGVTRDAVNPDIGCYEYIVK